MEGALPPQRKSSLKVEEGASPSSNRMSAIFSKRQVSSAGSKRNSQAPCLDRDMSQNPYATISRRRGKKVTISQFPPVADYFRTPERLRYDLEKLQPDPHSLSNLVSNIKISAYTLSKHGQSAQASQDDDICQQVFLSKLSYHPENRFSMSDFHLLVKLIKAVKQSPDKPILMPLMGSIAHAFVTEMAGAFDLSYDELDSMRRDSEADKIKLGELLVQRINYLCADETSEEQLQKILAKPERINHIQHPKRELIRKMKDFSDLIITGVLPKNSVTCQIRGMFLVLIDHPERVKDDLEVNEVMIEANRLLAETPETSSIDTLLDLCASAS